jgi:3-oxoadipate enol-lactonase
VVAYDSDVGAWRISSFVALLPVTGMPRIATAALAALITLGALWSPTHAQSVPATVTGYVTVDSSRLYYEECGTGPTIVLVHDGLMGAASWDLIWPTLCRDAHVLRYDRRGVGRSSAPKMRFSQTADLEALLADRGVSAATVVGSSAGGAIAIDFALEHPNRVQRLVLLGPVVDGLGFSAHFIQREERNTEPLVRGDVAGAIEKLLQDPFTLEPGNAAVRRKVRETLTAHPQNLRSLSTTNRLVDWPAVPAAARLGDLRVPALILVGEHDIPDVHAHAGAIELGMGGARREIVSGGGHLIQLDHPALVGPRILAFITETPVLAVPVERLQMLAGTYTPVIRDQPGDFYVKGGRLTTHFAGSRDVPLFAANDSTFYAMISPSRFQVSFHRDSTGKGSAADVTLNGVTHRATMVSPNR